MQTEVSMNIVRTFMSKLQIFFNLPPYIHTCGKIPKAPVTSKACERVTSGGIKGLKIEYYFFRKIQI